MVPGALLDLVGAVELFQEHDPGQVVGEGHGGHAQPQVRLGLQGGVEPHAAADEEGELALARQAEVHQALCQLRAGQHFPLHAQGYQGAASGQLLPDGGGLTLQGGGDLAGSWVLRKPLLRELQDLQAAVAAQALGVLRRRVYVEPLLQLSHAQDGHLLHSAPSSRYSSPGQDRGAAARRSRKWMPCS